MWYGWGRGKAHTEFRWRNLRERELGRPRQDGRIILKWIYSKWHGGVWTKLLWLRVGAGGGGLV
jgi:hypothetical protein